MANFSLSYLGQVINNAIGKVVNHYDSDFAAIRNSIESITASLRTKASITSVPTKTSQIENDSTFQTLANVDGKINTHKNATTIDHPDGSVTLVKLGSDVLDENDKIKDTNIPDTIARTSEIPDIVDNLTTNDSTKVLSAKQGKVLQDGKEPNLPSGGTISNYLKGNKTWGNFATSMRSILLSGFEVGGDTPVTEVDNVVTAFGKTQGQINAVKSDKVDKTSIINNLTTDDATKVLSAKQGKVLNDNFANVFPNVEINTSLYPAFKPTFVDVVDGVATLREDGVGDYVIYIDGTGAVRLKYWVDS